MRTLRALSAVGCLLAATLPASAIDPARIDRTIEKEPRYENGSPRYCLLVFGPETKHRVWLVQDGDTLYVDRDADGDLTDPGERVAASASDRISLGRGVYLFELADFGVGGREHRKFLLLVRRLAEFATSDSDARPIVAEDEHAGAYTLSLEVEIPGRRGDGIGGRVVQMAGPRDPSGYLQFGKSPADAPVLHFAGPWRITLFSDTTLAVDRTTEVILGLATPGVGAGTTIWTGYEKLVPEGLKPTLAATFPSSGGPVRELYELPLRC